MRRALWLPLLCALAFVLSWGYVAFYLRGGPRIIDATSYFLEARSLAAGGFSFDVPQPSASFRGRFLLPDTGSWAFPARSDSLGVIFPPGYPLLLSLGVWLGAPMLVGPTLGALLVAATYALSRALDQDVRVAWTAATLSVVCAALRYHTADTMSHGLSAVLGIVALTCALRRDLRAGPALAGLCLGLLFATRPVSAVVSLLLVGFVLRRAGRRSWLSAGLGLLPGVALLLLQQRLLTGSFFGSVQLAYYALADAPPGCFRYGFGSEVGCRFEHGDFVQRYLPNGYGLTQAARNLLVRLALFSVDATNTVPLTLLAGYAAVKHFRSKLNLLGGGIALQALAYVPFYFDGNYPGGGARFLSEAIPLCQVLVARALTDLRLERFAAPFALAGFVVHARHGHETLRDRQGGRPMFEPAVVARAGVTHGLLFVDTDHGFNLGHQPGLGDPRSGLLVARHRGDANDRELYERLGQPPTYRYQFDLAGRTAPQVASFIPGRSARFESEAEWPAELRRGSAYPIHFPCASAGKALRLFPGTRVIARRVHGVPLLAADLAVGWVSTTATPTEVAVGWIGGPKQRFSALGPGCVTWHFTGALPPDVYSVPRAGASLQVELVRGEGALDYVGPLGQSP
jgi:hypothetical protein